MPNSRELTDISGELIPPYETEKAFHFYDGTRTEWLAKSMVEWDASDRNPNVGVMTMPLWIALDKGFI